MVVGLTLQRWMKTIIFLIFIFCFSLYWNVDCWLHRTQNVLMVVNCVKCITHLHKTQPQHWRKLTWFLKRKKLNDSSSFCHHEPHRKSNNEHFAEKKLSDNEKIHCHGELLFHSGSLNANLKSEDTKDWNENWNPRQTQRKMSKTIINLSLSVINES